jgi:riboflavin kinase/FMN adenylyltransferase
LRAPLSGVFAVEVYGAADGMCPGVANVGVRPTIGDLSKAILEVHLLNFNQNIYGRKIRVVFRKKLRDEVKFDGLDALQAQIALDVEQARTFFDL